MREQVLKESEGGQEEIDKRRRGLRGATLHVLKCMCCIIRETLIDTDRAMHEEMSEQGRGQ